MSHTNKDTDYYGAAADAYGAAADVYVAARTRAAAYDVAVDDADADAADIAIKELFVKNLPGD